MNTRYLKVFDSFAHSNRWILAISGGGDSMAMLNMVYEWTLQRSRFPRITVVNINHGTGNMADMACKIVRHWAMVYGFEFVTTLWQPKAIGNFYAAARKFRYEFLRKMCQEGDAIFTAHHMQDSSETMLINMERGSGIDGICGIPEVSMIGSINLVRPLISLTKCDITRYLSERNFPWIEDRANYVTKFRRAFHRHNTLPMLGDIAHKKLSLLSYNARSARDALNYYANIEYQNCTQNDGVRIILSLDRFSCIPGEIQRKIVLRAASEILGSQVKARMANLNQAISRILDGKNTVFCGVQFNKTSGALLTLSKPRNHAEVRDEHVIPSLNPPAAS